MKSICRFGQRGAPGAQIQGLFHWNPFFTFHSQKDRTWTPGRLLAPYRSQTQGRMRYLWWVFEVLGHRFMYKGGTYEISLVGV